MRPHYHLHGSQRTSDRLPATLRPAVVSLRLLLWVAASVLLIALLAGPTYHSVRGNLPRSAPGPSLGPSQPDSRLHPQDGGPELVLFTALLGKEPCNICTVRMDGSGYTNLTHGITHEFDPAWSPDRTQIAFVGCGLQGGTDLWVMRADGNDRRMVARQTDRGRFLLTPTWAPDGVRIAYAVVHMLGGEPIHLEVLDTRSGRIERAGSVPALFPSWSPSGSSILCMAPKGLVVIQAAGGHQRLLDRAGVMGAWSPDGSRIAYVRRSARYNYQLWVMNRTGGDRRALLGSASGYCHPAWSVDGKTVIVTRLASNPSHRGAILAVDGKSGTARTVWFGDARRFEYDAHGLERMVFLLRW